MEGKSVGAKCPRNNGSPGSPRCRRGAGSNESKRGWRRSNLKNNNHEPRRYTQQVRGDCWVDIHRAACVHGDTKGKQRQRRRSRYSQLPRIRRRRAATCQVDGQAGKRRIWIFHNSLTKRRVLGSVFEPLMGRLICADPTPSLSQSAFVF